MVKKIDRMIATSYVGPFVVAFGIAVFVLVLQFLWLYIDEIAGKGVSILVMMELISYLSISTFPMALPIAVLIASAMVYGNMAERYELPGIKSAGMSLLRSMAGLMVLNAGVALFSYVCSDFIIPIANLKFKSRLYDIRRQKPALVIEEGVFNEDFRQFAIRVGQKEKDDETIRAVMIEDQTSGGRMKFSKILADSGQMYTTDDKRYFVMNLFRGTQYQEPLQGASSQQSRYPFIRTSFQSWAKVWDMKEFEMVASDEERFKTGRTQLSMSQLRKNLDSLQKTIRLTKQGLADDYLVSLKKTPAPPPPSVVPAAPAPATEQASKTTAFVKKIQGRSNIGPAAQTPQEPAGLMPQRLTKPLTEYNSFLETFSAELRKPLLQDASNRAKGNLTLLEARENGVMNRSKEYAKTGYELYSKYSFALACFIFLFIGAPMGAIIRKGGFGYPLLVSISFFVVFIVLSITSRKFAELYYLTPFWAAMVPCIVMLPIGAYLTYKATNDSSVLSRDRWDRFLFTFRTKWRKQAPPSVNPSL